MHGGGAFFGEDLAVETVGGGLGVAAVGVVEEGDPGCYAAGIIWDAAFEIRVFESEADAMAEDLQLVSIRSAGACVWSWLFWRAAVEKRSGGFCGGLVVHVDRGKSRLGS